MKFNCVRASFALLLLLLNGRVQGDQDEQQELEFTEGEFVPCSMCQDGSPITTPDAIIPELELSCAEVADEASNYPSDLGCRYYQRFGNACGCSNTAPAISRCELCQDSAQIPDPSLVPDNHDKSCEELQEDADWNLISAFDPPEEVNCNYYHYIGSVCGCPNNAPLDNGCTLCSGGSAPPNNNKPFSPGNGAEATCGTFASLVEFSLTAEDQACTNLQSTTGAYCGCASPPVNACPMCPEGTVVANKVAPDADIEIGDISLPLIDASCALAERTIAEVSSAAMCAEAPERIVAECCVEPGDDKDNNEIEEQVIDNGGDEDESSATSRHNKLAKGTIILVAGSLASFFV